MKIRTLVKSIFRKQQDSLYVRSAREEDINEIMEIERNVWSEDMCATKEMFLSRIRTFPEGFLCAIKNNKIVGFVCSEIIYYKDTKKIGFDWYSLTDNGYIIKSHSPSGDSLYGISLSVLPQNSKIVVAKLIEGLGKLIIKKGLKRTVFGARIPKYYKHAHKMSVEKYIFSRTKKGFFIDPELALYQTLGIYPVRLIKDYFKDDRSLNYGVLVTWKNPYHKGIKLFPFLANALSNLWRIRIYKAYEAFKVGKKKTQLYIEEE